ncbi:50S ribosomal protein L24 [Bryobacterales bacterium F-183]|nr:50S ribosomal protein L24 [Bryobacterales bacterium F-183]
MAKPTPRRHANAPKDLLKLKLKKDDVVKVISGKDKGKTGRIIGIDRETGRVIVEGVQIVKKHTRPNPARQIKGGIAESEGSIHHSNVMLLTSGGVPTRVSIKKEGNARVRVAKESGETLDKK